MSEFIISSIQKSNTLSQKKLILQQIKDLICSKKWQNGHTHLPKTFFTSHVSVYETALLLFYASIGRVLKSRGENFYITREFVFNYIKMSHTTFVKANKSLEAKKLVVFKKTLNHPTQIILNFKALDSGDNFSLTNRMLFSPATNKLHAPMHLRLMPYFFKHDGEVERLTQSTVAQLSGVSLKTVKRFKGSKMDNQYCVKGSQMDNQGATDGQPLISNSNLIPVKDFKNEGGFLKSLEPEDINQALRNILLFSGAIDRPLVMFHGLSSLRN